MKKVTLDDLTCDNDPRYNDGGCMFFVNTETHKVPNSVLKKFIYRHTRSPRAGYSCALRLSIIGDTYETKGYKSKRLAFITGTHLELDFEKGYAYFTNQALVSHTF